MRITFKDSRLTSLPQGMGISKSSEPRMPSDCPVVASLLLEYLLKASDGGRQLTLSLSSRSQAVVETGM